MLPFSVQNFRPTHGTSRRCAEDATTLGTLTPCPSSPTQRSLFDTNECLSNNISRSKQNHITILTRYKLTVLPQQTFRTCSATIIVFATKINRKLAPLEIIVNYRKQKPEPPINRKLSGTLRNRFCSRAHLTRFPAQTSIVFSQSRAKDSAGSAAAIFGRAGLQSRRKECKSGGALAPEANLFGCRMDSESL
jgi:hypothetical protein